MDPDSDQDPDADSDQDQDPDPAIFVMDLQGANKKQILYHTYGTATQYHTLVFNSGKNMKKLSF
jgi:hypothetical protein